MKVGSRILVEPGPEPVACFVQALQQGPGTRIARVLKAFAVALLGNCPVHNTEPPRQNAQSYSGDHRDAQYEQHHSSKGRSQPGQSLPHWSIVIPLMSMNNHPNVTALSRPKERAPLTFRLT